MSYMVYRTRKRVAAGLGATVLVAACYLANVPNDFAPATVSIAQGSSASTIARKLADVHVIAHMFPLQLMLRLTGGDSRVQAGRYRFNWKENTFIILYRLVTADYGLPQAHITIPEGATTRDMAELLTAELPGIESQEFISAAKPYEGYLFPDTYVFPPSASATSVIAMMRDNFIEKTAALKAEIASSTISFSEIVVMASIIEREARTDESRKMVSGILWNRLEKNMPLQVDAVFGYINGRDTYSPKFSDLKVDSPYNTYKYKGLPPGPISNPGTSSLMAALKPTKSKYLYYLTGNDGLMHYATTYAEHEANRRMYLE